MASAPGNVRNAGALAGENPTFLGDLFALFRAFPERVFTITSGKRTAAQSRALGGTGTDPHTRGIAADITIDGRPIGDVVAPAIISRYGLLSGNVAGFWPGHDTAYPRAASDPAGADPVHVQLATPGRPMTVTGWEAMLLRELAAPASAGNVALLNAWRAAEGGSAANNPLNTTQAAPGASNYNSAGVKNYPSLAVGIRATAQTLANGRYNGIVRDLRAGTLAGGDIVRRNASEFDTWGTGASHLLAALGAGAVGASVGGSAGRPPRPAASGGGGGGVGDFFGDILSPADSLWKDALGIFDTPWAVLKAMLWLLKPSSWLRMVEFVAGIGIMLLSLIGLALVLAARSQTAQGAADVAAALPGPAGAAGRAVKVAGAGSEGRRRRKQAATRAVPMRVRERGAQREGERHERDVARSKRLAKARAKGRNKVRYQAREKQLRREIPDYDVIPF